jgi:hypothetical protein
MNLQQLRLERERVAFSEDYMAYVVHTRSELYDQTELMRDSIPTKFSVMCGITVLIMMSVAVLVTEQTRSEMLVKLFLVNPMVVISCWITLSKMRRIYTIYTMR